MAGVVLVSIGLVVLLMVAVYAREFIAHGTLRPYWHKRRHHADGKKTH